jgi:Bacterial Ig-like domain (group 3)/IPT/TIG domain/Concanavalin A-like lectin/glucanases superfamily
MAMAATGASAGPLAGNPFATEGNGLALARGDGLAPTQGDGPAPAGTPSRYEEVILADHPIIYLPLTETSGSIAFDHSKNGLDGTYDLGVVHEGPGPLLDEPNVAVYGEGQVVSQSGDKLPSGSSPRTVEFWLHNVATESFTPFRYGDIEGGHGFAVTLHTGTLTVEANGHSVSATTADGFGHWCCDGTGWHMVDVTYDGTSADIYQDGQLIGSGTLGAAETEVPGQGLRLDTSHNACCGGAAPYGFAETAVYPTVLSPEQIGAHWSAGASLHEESECAPMPTGPYPKAVLEDSPLVYYRVGERAAYPADRVAFDSSGHCDNGTLDLGATSGDGALTGDENNAIFGEGQVVFQSGEELPSESAPRTVEFWLHNVATESFTPLRYGDIEGGHGFAVTLHTGTLTVEANGHSVSATTNDGFGHWCCDGTGWHMVDVTYDGTSADIYQDGQLIGSGPLPEVDTLTPGQGLRLDTSHNACCGGAAPYGLDEVAIYPSALTSAQIVAHWEAASVPPAGEAIIAGTVANGGGGRVQACPTSGEPCHVDPYGIDTSGAFHMLVPEGTYTVTVFAPPGSNAGPKTFGPLTVPPSDLSLHTGFTTPGGIPEEQSLSSPGRGTQEDVVPTINWGEPSTVTVKGCKGGFGFVFVHATNTSTGAREVRTAALTETSAESGAYTAQLPPLAPLHGQAGVESSVSCPGHSHVIPDGGSSNGGMPVLLGGTGFTGATAVHFGAAAASSFTVEADNRISAVAPSGTGDVPVTVTGASGATINVGMYHYFDITSLEKGSGPAGGGETIAIYGHGFTNATGVVFGTMLAQSYTVVNDEEILAKTPVGVGTVNVQVIDGLALTQPTAQTRYAYQGGPAGSSGISENVDNAASFSLAAQDAGLCSSIPDPSDSGGIDFRPLCNNVQDELSPIHFFGDSLAALGIFAGPVLCIAGGPIACAAVIGAEVGYWAWRVGVRACLFNCPNGELWNLWIDPSGTVVDTTGNPIQGAEATLLGEVSGTGAFAALEPSGGAIEPAENPEQTSASGQFDWDALAGTYEVEASAPGCHAPGQAGQANVFTSPFVIPPPAVGLMLTLECPATTAPVPKITGLSVSSGSTAGGNVVDILGEGLAGVRTVHFGPNISVHVQPLSAYAVAAIVPAGTGTVDVTASGAGGTSVTGESDRYTYAAPLVSESSPVVESVAPNTGPLSGGTVVTIKGNHLGGALAVQFAGASSTQVTPISASEVRAVAPAAAFPARVDITVTTSAGSSAPTLADGFVYGSPPPPVATGVALTPSQGAAPLGQAITLEAIVAPTDGGGSVAFYADGSSTPLGNCGAQALTMKDGVYKASCSTSSLVIGSHALSATYSGDASYAESSGATSVLVTHTAEEAAKAQAEEEVEKRAEEAAKEQAEEEAATRKRVGEEANQKTGAEAVAKRQAEEAAAAKRSGLGLREEKSNPKPPSHAQLLANALKACKKEPKQKREKCEDAARKDYGHKAKPKGKHGKRRKLATEPRSIRSSSALHWATPSSVRPAASL